MIIANFKGQDYKKLKIKCNPKNLFVDPIFKADQQSLFYNENGRFKKSMDSQLIEWLRPEVCYSQFLMKLISGSFWNICSYF